MLMCMCALLGVMCNSTNLFDLLLFIYMKLILDFSKVKLFLPYFVLNHMDVAPATKSFGMSMVLVE